MKTVEQTRFPLSQLPVFAGPEQKHFHTQFFAKPSIPGHMYQVAHLQDGGRSAWKEDTLNKCSEQDFISIPFTCYSCRDTQGTVCSQEFPGFSFIINDSIQYGSDIP